MIAGLTGKYCSGKNSVAAEFEKRGFFHIEVDRLGHEALDAKRDEIEKVFGSGVIEDGRVSRPKLGKIVFRNEDKKHQLERIVHPVMVETVKRLIEENRGRNILINAAILAQMGLHRLCDAVIWVQSPFLHRLARAISRDCLPAGAVFDRMMTQRKLKPNLTRKDVDTYIIDNSGSIDDLAAGVEKVLKLMESRK